jgi:TetR/AcrR family transcriptional regulator, repressor of fatR-cypB operon
MPKAKDENKIGIIQEAARKLVIKTGFGGLKMADVATEAKMATGTLYIYYKNKEELINDIYFTTKSEIIDIMLNPNNQAETFFKTFQNMWMGYFNFCFQNPEKMLFVEQFIHSGYIYEENIKLLDQRLKPVNDFINQGQSNGLLKQIDCEIIKAHMEGSIHDIIKVIQKFNITLTPEVLNKCFEMTWGGVKQ